MTTQSRPDEAADTDYLAALDAAVEAGYPRPRLVRDGFVDLTGPWEFCFDDGDVGRDQHFGDPGAPVFDRSIIVPFPFESERSGIGEAGPHPVLWYRRTITLPDHGADERVVVHFGAVDYAAQVFLDGALLTEHEGGHTPFSATLPADAAGEVCLVVRAEDQPGDLAQPRGKQDWRDAPHSVWYGRTGGIWQPVWLEVVPATHLCALDFDSDVVRGEIAWSARLSTRTSARVRLRLSMGGELVAEHECRALAGEVSAHLALPALANAWEWEHLEWSPEHPRRLGAEVALLDEDGAVVDSARSYLGIRSVGARDGQFVLNRRPYRLRLVLTQGYWPDTHLAAPSRLALRDEVELIKSLGFNGARVHQKIEDPLFLYWCDRLGLVVWEEMPSCGAFSRRAVRRLFTEWAEAIERDRSHPCIVVWVPFNESWGVPAIADRPEQASLVRGLAELTRSLDPSRPVVSNDGWEHTNSDLFTIHDYARDPAVLLERYGDAAALAATLSGSWPAVRALSIGPAPSGLPVILSEFGGVALPAEHDGAWHGYSDAEDPAGLAERLDALFTAIAECRALAGFCYTQLCDTDQEENGLAWPDRKPKLPASEIAALITRQPGR
ncbi:MAG: glycoside hydrolase family 2 [Actinomycetota bacterium]|nr:glycoside hydrolase family 2 [Actinomycetota bacterium]